MDTNYIKWKPTTFESYKLLFRFSSSRSKYDKIFKRSKEMLNNEMNLISMIKSIRQISNKKDKYIHKKSFTSDNIIEIDDDLSLPPQAN